MKSPRPGSFSRVPHDRSAAVVIRRGANEGRGDFNCSVCSQATPDCPPCGHGICWVCVRTLRLTKCPVCRSPLPVVQDPSTTSFCTSISEVGRRLRKLLAERDVPVLSIDEYRTKRTEVVAQVPFAIAQLTALDGAVEACQLLEQLYKDGLLQTNELGLGHICNWLRTRLSSTPLDALHAAARSLDRFPPAVRQAVLPDVVARLESLMDAPGSAAVAWCPVVAQVAPGLSAAERRSLLALAVDVGLREVEQCRSAPSLEAWVRQSAVPLVELVKSSGLESCVIGIHRQLLGVLQRHERNADAKICTSGVWCKWLLGRAEYLLPWHERRQALAIADAFACWTRHLAQDFLAKARERVASPQPGVRRGPLHSPDGRDAPDPQSPDPQPVHTLPDPQSPLPLRPLRTPDRRAAQSPRSARSPMSLRQRRVRPEWCGVLEPQQFKIACGAPRSPTKREQSVGTARKKYADRERTVCQRRRSRAQPGPREEAWSSAVLVVHGLLDELDKLAVTTAERQDILLWKEGLRSRAPLIRTYQRPAKPCENTAPVDAEPSPSFEPPPREPRQASLSAPAYTPLRAGPPVYAPRERTRPGRVGAPPRASEVRLGSPDARGQVSPAGR